MKYLIYLMFISMTNFVFSASFNNDSNTKSNGGYSTKSNKTKASGTKARRDRFIFTSQQLMVLKNFFKEKEYLDPEMSDDIISRTGIPHKIVRVWFQNQRSKKKKMRNEKSKEIAVSSAPINLPPNFPTQSNVHYSGIPYSNAPCVQTRSLFAKQLRPHELAVYMEHLRDQAGKNHSPFYTQSRQQPSIGTRIYHSQDLGCQTPETSHNSQHPFVTTHNSSEDNNTNLIFNRPINDQNCFFDNRFPREGKLNTPAIIPQSNETSIARSTILKEENESKSITLISL
jgi:hypothetical protein